jgi:hypothetical protein
MLYRACVAGRNVPLTRVLSVTPTRSRSLARERLLPALASCLPKPGSRPVHQTPFQHTLWLRATEAHAVGDRADSRIMLKMIEAIDDGDYGLLRQLSLALRQHYRDRVGPVPERRAQDLSGGAAE